MIKWCLSTEIQGSGNICKLINIIFHKYAAGGKNIISIDADKALTKSNNCALLKQKTEK